MTSRYQRPLIWAGEQIDILAHKVALLEERIEALEAKPKRGRPRKTVSKPSPITDLAQAIKVVKSEESLPMG